MTRDKMSILCTQISKISLGLVFFITFAMIIFTLVVLPLLYNSYEASIIIIGLPVLILPFLVLSILFKILGKMTKTKSVSSEIEIGLSNHTNLHSRTYKLAKITAISCFIIFFLTGFLPIHRLLSGFLSNIYYVMTMLTSPLFLVSSFVWYLYSFRK